jgi:hypothetical protein
MSCSGGTLGLAFPGDSGFLPSRLLSLASAAGL